MTRQRNIRSLAISSCACLGLLCASPILAQQNATENARSQEEQQDQRSQRQNRRQTESPEQAQLPAFLQDLDLSSEQQAQIKQGLAQHNQQLRQTWRQFQDKHGQAIELEAAWAAAVRDSLSDEDQRKFDQQRMQNRELSSRDADRPRNSAAERRQENRARRQADQAQQRRQSDVDDATERRQQQRDGDQNDAEAEQEVTQDEGRAATARAQRARDRETVGLILITTASPESFLQGTNQTSQQKEQCAEACRQYQEKLTSVWSDLHQLHHKLVQIEAQRIQVIEDQLTDAQMARLQENRQEPKESQSTVRSRQ